MLYIFCLLLLSLCLCLGLLICYNAAGAIGIYPTNAVGIGQVLFCSKIHKGKNICKPLAGLKSAILGILQELLFCCCCCHCFLCFGLWRKGTAQKVKKKFICYCFCNFFCYTRALVPAVLRHPALVVVACVPVFGGRSGACAPALAASFAILLMLARWERTHAPTPLRAYIYTHTRAIIFRPAIFRL